MGSGCTIDYGNRYRMVTVDKGFLDNAKAGKLELSSAEVTRIEEAFPRGPRPRSLPMI